MGINLDALKQFRHQQPYLQLAVTAMESLQPHFEGHSQLKVKPTGSTSSDEFEITLVADPMGDGQPMDILVMEFSNGCVSIPNMILPPEIQYREAMIGALGQMADAAVPLNYQVIVRDLVRSQHRRLVMRDAHQLAKHDEVVLYTGMNFQPSTQPSA